jgi:uracil-DNA glycosylase
MIETWEDLKFWSTGEWQVIQERLDDLERHHVVYNPRREWLFRSMELCPFSSCRLCVVAQDPYPSHDMATGLAFSIPKTSKKIPLSLQNILKEYGQDLGYSPKEMPKHGCLDAWAEQGVLLWNSIPTCEEGKAGSHRDWNEWDLLTQEIVQELSDKGIVFALIGTWAHAYAKFIDEGGNEILKFGHPSPLNKSKLFVGSRFFSTINAKLVGMKLSPIEWRL